MRVYRIERPNEEERLKRIVTGLLEEIDFLYP